ncbi:MAG: hypothetical protein ACLP19_26415 [Xanthobacteraceae bacterium]
MRVIAAWIVGIALAANGLTMLAVPDTWYALVPGVADTGPFNPHFVRDIGAAYLVAGAGLVWFAASRGARPAAQAAAAFLAIHALVHLWDAAAGREHIHQWLVDLPTVFLPPALAIWIAWSPRHAIQTKGEANDQMASAPESPSSSARGIMMRAICAMCWTPIRAR